MQKLITCLLLLAAACQEKGPTTPTAQQSAQLDDTEHMLNDLAKNEEGPEQRPGPSNSSN